MVKDLRAVITRKDKKAKEKEDQVNKSKTTSNNTGGVTCTELPSDAAREARGHWKHPLDFLFSCISVSVGLGSTYYRYTFFRQITTFIKVRLTIVFGLQTLQLIDFTKIY